MTPKRPVETNKESEEKRQWIDGRLNTDDDLQTTAGPALTTLLALNETPLSRWAEEVTRRLQGQNAEPLPSPRSQPRSIMVKSSAVTRLY